MSLTNDSEPSPTPMSAENDCEVGYGDDDPTESASPGTPIARAQDRLSQMRLFVEVGRADASEPTDATELTDISTISLVDPQFEGAQLGDYRIVRQIGRGGMGVVFEAIQVSLGRRIALKVLPLSLTGNAQSAERVGRFEREALAVANLEHPRIVRAYAHSKHDGMYCLAMQYIEGINLFKFVQIQRSRLAERSNRVDESGNRATDWSRPDSVPQRPPETTSNRVTTIVDRAQSASGYFQSVAHMGYQVAEALQFAHENGIVHRDIKPSNLILDELGDVWVADFGLAMVESVEPLTLTGQAIGTLRYSSPEQAVGREQITAATDVYSLGATLYELVTLRAPFSGLTSAPLLGAIVNDEPIRPRTLDPKVPQDLESILLKAMSKEPRHRYETAWDLACDLKRFMRHEPVRAKSPSILQRAARWTQRNRALSLMMATVVVLLAIASLSLVIIGVQRERIVEAFALSNKRLDESLRAAKDKAEIAKAQQRYLERQYYTADLANLGRLAKHGEYQDIGKGLDKHRPQTPDSTDLRGFLWRYYNASCNRISQTLDDHEYPVLCSAHAPILKMVATADKRGTIRLWDTTTWHCVRTLRFPGEVQDLQFSPDARWFLACGTGDQIQVYDTDTWSLDRVLMGHEMTVKSLAFSPKGERLYSASRDHTIAFWDTDTWGITQRFVAHDTVQHISLSADGRWLASGGSDGKLRTWDAETGEPDQTFQGHSLPVLATAISSDGRFVASGGYDGHFCLWDRISGEQLATVSIRSQTWCMRFVESDSALIVGINRGELRVFNLQNPRSPRLVRRIRLHDDIVRSFEVLSEPQRLLTISDDTKVIVTDGPSVTALTSRPISVARSVVFSPCGKQIAISHYDGGVSIYDRSGTRLKSHPLVLAEQDFSDSKDGERPPAIAFDSSGELHAIWADERKAIWTSLVDSPSESHSLDFNSKLEKCWIADRCDVALGIDVHPEARLWALASGELLDSFLAPARVSAATFSKDSRWIAMVTHDGKVVLRDRGKGESISLPSLTQEGLYDVDFSPDSTRLAAAGFDGVVMIWDVNSLQLLGQVREENRVISLAFSTDGRYLAIASSRISIWHVDSTRLMGSFGPSYPGKVYESVAFSPADDCLIAVADRTKESEFYIWDTEEN